jgi:nitroreductase
VMDPARRAALGELYARAFEIYRTQPHRAANLHADDPRLASVQERVTSSAEYLAAHMGEMPVLIVPCLRDRADGQPVVRQASRWGSIVPAIWSFMLAARSRGLGTSYTTMHLSFEEEAAALLGIPYADYTQAALIPVGYTLGTDFKPGARIPLDTVLHVDTW